MKFRWSQVFQWPALQEAHLPQVTSGRGTTWSPTLKFLTSGPTAETTPANSWPMVTGLTLPVMLDPSNAPAKEGWLYMLMRTLRLLYGERWRMDIDTSRGAGTTVTVAIPRTARGGHA